MSETQAKIVCDSCKRSYNWKPELAGKKVKCKCGQSIAVAAMAKPVEEPADDLYAFAELAADAKKAAKSIPQMVLPDAPALAAEAAPVAAAAPRGTQRVPLGYARTSPRERERASNDVFIDKKRDIYVPLILFGIGAILYLGYYTFHFHLGMYGMFGASIGLAILNIIETAILVGFALVVAGPLGVSFGSVGTAILKLAAIALFCDGVTVWIDGFVESMMGGGGGVFGYGAIGLPIAAGIYWVTMIYLFTMDPGDSWMVVVILAVFYRILRIVLLLLLLQLILNWGGAGRHGTGLPAINSGGSTSVADETAQEVDDAKAANVLKEGRQFVKDRTRSAESATVEGWYAAGCKNVWFEITKDINGKGDAFQMIAELPKDKASRAKCFDLGKAYYTAYKHGDPEELQDTGQAYLMVGLP